MKLTIVIATLFSTMIASAGLVTGNWDAAKAKHNLGPMASPMLATKSRHSFGKIAQENKANKVKIQPQLNLNQ